MKRRKARDMLARRTRRGREDEFFTASIVRWVGSKSVFCYWRLITFLGECFWIIEDIFEFVGHVEDFIQKEVGEI